MLSDLPAPTRLELQRICTAILPGSAPTRPRRLNGGIDASMHEFGLVAPKGERRRLVLRRHGSQLTAVQPETAVRGWRMLALLEQAGFPAPRPVLYDGDGGLAGVPAFVMTRVPGHGLLRPRDPPGWMRQLAGTLALLHRLSVERYDLSFLPGPRASLNAQEIAGRMVRMAAHPDAAAVAAVLRTWLPRARVPDSVLNHGDYWSGNTVWYRDRLSAVVDWDGARLDPPFVDVSYCRVDLACMMGMQEADAFLHAYEEAAGLRVTDLFFWDLIAAIRGFPDPGLWVSGYHGLGRRDTTAEGVRRNMRAFVADALRRAQLAE